MTRYAITNEEGSVTIHVWAFDENDAIERVEKLTDSSEFRKVKNVGDG